MAPISMSPTMPAFARTDSTSHSAWSSSAGSLWDRTRTGGKKGFDKVWGYADKLGAPVNRLSNKLGSEAFWPTTLDKESDKAARILRSFCRDGFYEEETLQTQDGPKQKQKVLKKIPQKVIREAKGLAIFTTMRSGLWVSGAGGSGVLVGRKADGSWSPPSGIMLHTAGLGFLIGVDIYDCVVVINTEEALQGFSKLRCTLGAETSVVAGPLGAGGILESEVHKRRAPIWTYLKSRGFYAGVQIDGTVVIERTDENERFYGYKIGVADILAGKVRRVPPEVRVLLETVKAAQGDQYDEKLLPDSQAPSDMEVERNGKVFGVPDKEDLDPYGVLALEKQGLEIREAGTQSRPGSEQFDFRPSPTSPVFGTFNRQSVDSVGTRSRESYLRRLSVDRSTQTESIATQTDDTPSDHSRMHSVPEVKSPLNVGTEVVEAKRRSPESLDGSRDREDIDDNRPRNDEDTQSEYEPPSHADLNAEYSHSNYDEDDSKDESRDTDGVEGPEGPYEPYETEESEEAEEEAVEYHAPVSVPVQKAAPQVISKARLVSIPKRLPPALPPRSPARRKISVNGDPGSPDPQAHPMSSASVSPLSSPPLGAGEGANRWSGETTWRPSPLVTDMRADAPAPKQGPPLPPRTPEPRNRSDEIEERTPIQLHDNDEDEKTPIQPRERPQGDKVEKKTSDEPQEQPPDEKNSAQPVSDSSVNTNGNSADELKVHPRSDTPENDADAFVSYPTTPDEKQSKDDPKVA